MKLTKAKIVAYKLVPPICSKTEATTIEYNLEEQLRKKQNKTKPSKRLQKECTTNISDENEVTCPICKRKFKKRVQTAYHQNT